MDDIQPSAVENAERKAFWKAYCEWLAQASEQELEQLSACLTAMITSEVRSRVNVIREALHQEAIRRDLPQSLLQQLRDSSWPAAPANARHV
jgi:Trp operon repressor